MGWQRYGKDLYNYSYGDDYTSSEYDALEASDTYSRVAFENVTVDDKTVPCEVTTHYISGVAVDREYTNALGQTVMTCSVLNGQNIGEIYYVYDDYGRLTRKYYLDEDDEEVLISSYTYDYDGKVLSETNFDGNTKNTTYDANGNLATETTGTAVTSYSYNDANMVTAMSTESDDETITSFSYTYYTDGNQRTKTDTILNKVSAYHYDGTGLLISEIYSDLTSDEVLSSKMYFYDPSGNRIMLTEYDGETFKTVASEYNCLNQLVSSTDSETNETTTYAYDDYGNLISDGKYEYSYDEYYNRLDYVHNLETDERIWYEYCVDGLRKCKDNTYFIWLDGNMVYEFTPTDSNSYTYGHRLLYSDNAKYVLNAHGDVVALLNSDGETVKAYDYDAFGNELNPSESDTNPFRYCAEYFDTENGTIYLRARYYSPTTGRFTQQDPIKDGLNWYAYCSNNPIVFVDSNGLFFRKIGNVIDEFNQNTAARQMLTYISYDQYKWMYGVSVFNQTANVIISNRIASSLNHVSYNKKIINSVSEKYGVPNEIIGGIIYKEQLTQSIPDTVANLDTVIFSGEHSTGLGAIFPDTARAAWSFVNDNYLLPESDTDLQFKLSYNREFNIETIAAVLIYEAKNAGYIDNPADARKLTVNQWYKAVAKYNGSDVYADKVYDYLPYIEELLD